MLKARDADVRGDLANDSVGPGALRSFDGAFQERSCGDGGDGLSGLLGDGSQTIANIRPA